VLLYHPGKRGRAEPKQYGVFPSITQQLGVMLSSPAMVHELSFPQDFLNVRGDVCGGLFSSPAWGAKPRAEGVLDLKLLLYYDPVNYGAGGVGPASLKCNQLFIFIENLAPQQRARPANVLNAFVCTGFHINSDGIANILRHLRTELTQLHDGISFVGADGLVVNVRAEVCLLRCRVLVGV
jgi:hypothetical protein